MKIPTDHETKFMEPMSDAHILEYAEFVVTELDEDEVITGAGMEFITRADNIPNEEDQERIMSLVEDMYRAREIEPEFED